MGVKIPLIECKTDDLVIWQHTVYSGAWAVFRVIHESTHSAFNVRCEVVCSGVYYWQEGYNYWIAASTLVEQLNEIELIALMSSH